MSYRPDNLIATFESTYIIVGNKQYLAKVWYLEPLHTHQLTTNNMNVVEYRTDKLRYLLVIPVLIWLLIISGMWLARSPDFFRRGPVHILDFATMPPFVEGTMETLKFFKTAVTSLIPFIPRILAAAIPTTLIHFAIMGVNRLVSNEKLKLGINVPFYALYILALVLQLRWTFNGLPTGLLEELRIVQFMFTRSIDAAAYVSSFFLMVFMMALPILLTCAILLTLAYTVMDTQ